MPLDWIDSHCHLDFLENPDESLAIAARAGVHRVIVPAVSPENFQRVIDLAHRHSQVFYALGLHPCSVNCLEEDALAVLKNALLVCHDDPKLVAVGEIGLDFFVQDLDRGRMMYLFNEQLRLARDFHLPVVLHLRKAQDQVCAGLRRFGIRSGIAHAFNGSLTQAHAFIDQGCVLGFGGAMTFTRALQIRRLASQVPEQSWVLETDSPDIPPAWLTKGQVNTPAELPQIAEVLAGLRGLSIQDAALQSRQNVLRALPRLASELIVPTTTPRFS